VSKRNVLLALGLLAGSLVLTCGVGLFALSWVAKQISFTPDWSHGALPPPGAEGLHGVTFPPRARNFYARETGFQDPMDELIFELDPLDVGAFLETNHFTRGPTVKADADEVLKMDGPPRATAIGGPESDEPDGGALQFFQSCELWEWPGRTFVYCKAWGS
jgi:hypothetical protein